MIEGGWYEASCYFYGHRGTSFNAYMIFTDKDGNWISSPQLWSQPAAQNGDPKNSLASYLRPWAKAQAPAGAVKAYVIWRAVGSSTSGVVNSYLWLTQLYVGRAKGNQTAASDWQPAGATLINGGSIVASAITTDLLAANAVTAAKIAAGAVTATQIAAGSVTTEKIAASSITGDKVAANTIGANNIAAGAITAKTLTLTDYTNLVPNGNFATTDLAGIWSINKGASDDVVTFADGFSSQGPRAMLLQKNTLTPAHDLYIALLPAYYIPVTGSAVYQYDISVWSNVGTSSGGFYVWLQWYDAGKNLLSKTDLVVNAAITGSRVRYTARITAPAGARFAQLGIYSNGNNTTTTNLLIDYIAFRLANAAELIVDGSITANKLAVNNLAAISATLGDVDISSARIGNLQVGRSNIPTGAISRVDFNNGNGQTLNINRGATASVVGQTAYHGTNNSFVMVMASFTLFAPGYDTTLDFIRSDIAYEAVNILIWDSVNNRYTASIPLSFFGAHQFTHSYVFQAPSNVSQTTFRFDVQHVAGGGSSNVALQAINTQIQCLTLFR